MMEATGESVSPRSPARLLALLLIGTALGVVLVYVASAAMLVRYRWEWSPDEGLTLDYARRLLHAPSTLYQKSVVPMPLVYTPLLPAVLLPVVATFAEPLPAARVVALLWTAAVVAAAYRLVRPRASPAWAMMAAAIVLLPLDVTFWYMLVRVDGLMIALWLWSAVVLLPQSLARGSETLTPRRLLAGTALLLAAVLTKPTAAAHAMPLVLAWLWVSPRSGVRLIGALALGGLSTLALLQVLSGGGFLWVNGLWGTHVVEPGHLSAGLWLFIYMTAPILAWCALGGIVAAASGLRPLRDPAILLVVGGFLMLPGMSKVGAWWNYILPGLAALVVVAGRWWSTVGRRGPIREWAAGLLTAALGLLAFARPFPLPTAADERTASAYHAFLDERVRQAGGLVLTNRPDYPYYRAGQPVEIDGSHFFFHVQDHLPGTERVLTRLLRREYAAASIQRSFWPRGEFGAALDDNYRRVGTCRLRFFFGPVDVELLVPRDQSVAFTPPPATRCMGSL